MQAFKRITHWLYGSRLLKHYESIDAFRYIKRLASGKGSDDGKYYSDKDIPQFDSDAEVLIRFTFRDHPCLMLCRPGSHIEAGLIRHSGHAMRLQHIIADHLHGGFFVDVGANVGTFSIPLAKAFPQETVIAFEPNPPAQSRLLRNLELNALDNIQVRGEGVGDELGHFTLFAFSGQDMGQSSFIRPAQHTEAPTEIKVAVVRLDDALPMTDPRKVDVIKIDVQGKEVAVLKGSQRLIEKHRPIILLEHEDSNFDCKEVAEKTRANLKEFFSSVGYEVFYITRKDSQLLFPVRWGRSLNGDLLAIPMTLKQ